MYRASLIRVLWGSCQVQQHGRGFRGAVPPRPIHWVGHVPGPQNPRVSARRARRARDALEGPSVRRCPAPSTPPPSSAVLFHFHHLYVDCTHKAHSTGSANPIPSKVEDLHQWSSLATFRLADGPFGSFPRLSVTPCCLGLLSGEGGCALRPPSAPAWGASG